MKTKQTTMDLCAEIRMQNEMIEGARRAASQLIMEREALSNALQECLSFLADLNGGGYLERKNVATIDMLQRSLALQGIAYNLLANNRRMPAPGPA